MKKKKVYLTLQDGRSFQGYRFGAEGDITGELVFSTGMVGYIETLTDPANYGQIVVQTFPLIGNYGMITADKESKKAWVSAYVVREICDTPSNFRTDGTLEDLLKEEGIVGIYGVDTRELTKILREGGAMNARISDRPLSETALQAVSSYKIENAVKMVARTEKEVFGSENAKYTVALWDFGSKKSTIENFVSKDCCVIAMPTFSTAEEILALNVDGVVLSDGPADPTEEESILTEVKKVIGKVPVMGIGLGHQIAAVALGAEVKKQKYGHRGSNQPVKSVDSGKVYISAQNHGYEVVADSIQCGRVNFVNVNDGSCEGIDYDRLNAFTVQFMPEACGIGYPENPLYNKFFALMTKEN